MEAAAIPSSDKKCDPQNMVADLITAEREGDGPHKLSTSKGPANRITSRRNGTCNKEICKSLPA